MFDTPYNRMIARKVEDINHNYARHSPVHTGMGRSGALEEANASLMFNPAYANLKEIKSRGGAMARGKRMVKPQHQFKVSDATEEPASEGDDEADMMGSAMARGRPRKAKKAVAGAKAYKKLEGEGFMENMLSREKALGQVGGAMARGRPRKAVVSVGKKLSKAERGQAVKEIMQKHGVKLGEASKMLKAKLEGRM